MAGSLRMRSHEAAELLAEPDRAVSTSMQQDEVNEVIITRRAHCKIVSVLSSGVKSGAIDRR